MEKKYKLTSQTIEVTYLNSPLLLYRIQALRDFSDIHKGDLGGYIAGEENLSQDEDCWIYDTSRVYPEARVWGNATVSNNSRIMGSSMIYGNAIINDSIVRNNAIVRGNAQIKDFSCIYDEALIEDNAVITNSIVQGESVVKGNSTISDDSNIEGNVLITDNAQIFFTQVIGEVCIRGDAVIRSISDYIVIKKWWNDGGYWTWTKSNGKWQNMHFCGTPKELLDYNKDEKYFISEYYKLFNLVK